MLFVWFIREGALGFYGRVREESVWTRRMRHIIIDELHIETYTYMSRLYDIFVLNT